MGATLVALMMHYAALCIIKTLEQERHAIDAVLLSTFGDAELRFGVRPPGGWVLEQRSRTSWVYAPEIRDANKGLQQQAQGGQQASHKSRYACTTRNGAGWSRSPLRPLAPQFASTPFCRIASEPQAKATAEPAT